MAKTIDVVRAFIGVLISMGIAIFFITMYAKHKNEHCEKKLVVWMLVTGLCQVGWAIVLAVGLLTYSKEDSEESSPLSSVASQPKGYGVAGLGCIVCVLSLFIFAWFIVGNVWTFGMAPNKDGKHCNQTVYLVCFWYLISCYVLIGLGCCCGCVFGCLFWRKK